MIDRERYYAGLMILLTSVYGGLVMAFAVFVDQKSLKILWIFGAVLLPALVWFVGKSRLLLFFIRLLDWKRRQSGEAADNLEGTWDINIEFKEDEKTFRRHGHLKIGRTTLGGYKIDGAGLYDIENEKTMNKWNGKDVIFIKRNHANILVYVYETYEESMDTSPTKIGVVVAGCPKGSKDFRGAFHDYSTSDPRHSLRTGIVRLMLADE